mmetsp:Transcript_20330/g.30238  ORF Transcript_20330/g.30238 Transcript_20330/m.30238 type:complete len:665 (-) Transcript_20330:294-2288(-)
MAIEDTFALDKEDVVVDERYADSSSTSLQSSHTIPLTNLHSSPSSMSSLKSLPLPLRFLYAANGATMQLPSIALMSIANDRAAIPPAYLPAYGAISFLPWSLKPVYAFLSALFVDESSACYEDIGGGDGIIFHNHRRRHVLLSALFISSGLSYIGTAFVPNGGVALCIIWGFTRGITGSWAEFLLDLTLLDTARNRQTVNLDNGESASSSPSEDGNNRDSPLIIPPYEELVSIFQSQAATFRSVGSLVASGVTFVMFLWRHYRKVETELSDAVVTALLFGTALMPIVGSFLTIKYKVGTFSNPSYHPAANNDLLITMHNENSTLYERSEAEESSSTLTCEISQVVSYNGIAVDEGIAEEECEEEKMYQNKKRQKQGDIASLLLFQTLLIMLAMQNPIVSATKKVVWMSLVISIGSGLAISLLYSWYCHHQCTKKSRPKTTAVVPPRKLALYLILRHAIPSAGVLMYSFIYTIFQKEPLLLQINSILQSAVTALATCSYERFCAKKFNSGWGIIGLITVLTIITALVSLLDIILVHIADYNIISGENIGSTHLYWIVFLVGIFTAYFGELNFMPSVVLASTNVIDDSVYHQSLVYNEGMQYATFVSCIDFGDQAAGWISVPIISYLGISRENNWANLEWFIVICAVAKFVSVVFLCLIRPTRQTG